MRRIKSKGLQNSVLSHAGRGQVWIWGAFCKKVDFFSQVPPVSKIDDKLMTILDDKIQRGPFLTIAE